MHALTLSNPVAFLPGGQSSCLQMALRPSALLRDRSNRVALILAAIGLMGFADLALTLNQMCNAGMFEANPVVAMLARTFNSAALIALFKVASMAFGLGILYFLRKKFQSEAASWVVLAAHIMMLVQWAQYSAVLNAAGNELLLMQGTDLIRLG
jgi:hypothetical protein